MKYLKTSQFGLRGFRFLLLLVVLLRCGLFASALMAGEEYDWSQAKVLSPGISLMTFRLSESRRMNVNCARIDLQQPGIKFYTTPRRQEWVSGKAETNRETVKNFVIRSQKTKKKLVLAVNADAFAPWPAPFDQETPSDLAGLAISEGVLVSRSNGTPSFLIEKTGTARIATIPPDGDVSGIELAVSGFLLCLKDGEVQPSGEDLHPRTGVGLSEERRFVYLMTIDGRQEASPGATTQDLGKLLKRVGAFNGINMDGGGSTTMVWWKEDAPVGEQAKILNIPVGRGTTKLTPEEKAAPFRPTERANGNNLGVYYVAP